MEKQSQHNFSGRVAEDKEEMSREDAKFVDITGQSVKLQDGHYSSNSACAVLVTVFLVTTL